MENQLLGKISASLNAVVHREVFDFAPLCSYVYV